MAYRVTRLRDRVDTSSHTAITPSLSDNCTILMLDKSGLDIGLQIKMSGCELWSTYGLAEMLPHTTD